MYDYKWIPNEYNIFRFAYAAPDQIIKKLRPVFKEELDFFDLNKVWEYPDTKSPILWAEGNRRYILNGNTIAMGKGGNIYEKPTVEIRDESVKSLSAVNIKKLAEANHGFLEYLENNAIKFIQDTYNKYCCVTDYFVVAFSGGKDSIVLLDLAARALPSDKFVVVFGDTSMEISDTYKAIERTKERYPALKFLTAKSHMPPVDAWREFGPPSRIRRWCCSVYESVPTLILLRELNRKKNIKTLVFDGVRSQESFLRSHYEKVREGTKHEFQVNASPLLEWNSAEIWLYLLKHDLLLNDGYRFGLGRIGCAVCPHASNWNDGIAGRVYKRDFAPFVRIVEDYAKGFKGEKRAREYILDRGWHGRCGGKGLPNGGNRVKETQENDSIRFDLDLVKQDWPDVCGVLGPVLEIDGNGGKQRIKGKEFNFRIENDGKTIIYFGLSEMNRILISRLRKLAKKAAYCIGCKSCVPECPTGAFQIDENGKIRIGADCVHCCKCVTRITDGCKVAWSLKVTKNI